MRHARRTAYTRSGFEFWVLRFRDLGVFVFEFWVLRFQSRVLRFRDLGASCLGLRFRVLRFRNYRFTLACHNQYIENDLRGNENWFELAGV